MSRLLAIGDIHGCSTALKTLCETVQIRPDDTVVILGDCMNRGPDTKNVVETLLDLGTRANLVVLMGNHEQMWLRALNCKEEEAEWKACGGETTLKSYGVSSAHELPARHQDFFREGLKFHEDEKHFFVHANADAYVPLESQTDDVLLWRHLSTAPSRHISGKTMICGHTPQANGLPRHWGTAICIDTNIQDGGWLTCLDVRRNVYWQANEKGQKRADVLEAPDEEW